MRPKRFLDFDDFSQKMVDFKISQMKQLSIKQVKNLIYPLIFFRCLLLLSMIVWFYSIELGWVWCLNAAPLLQSIKLMSTFPIVINVALCALDCRQSHDADHECYSVHSHLVSNRQADFSPSPDVLTAKIIIISATRKNCHLWRGWKWFLTFN